MRKMKQVLQLLIIIIFLLIGFWIFAFGQKDILFGLDSDIKSEHVSLEVLTPFSKKGQFIHIKINAVSNLAIAIQEIKVVYKDHEEIFPGRNVVNWDRSISQKYTDMGNDFQKIKFSLDENINPDNDILIDFLVRLKIAESTGSFSFEDKEITETLSIKLLASNSNKRLMMKLIEALKCILSLSLVFLFSIIGLKLWKSNFTKKHPESMAVISGCAIIGMGYIGNSFFAQPVSAILNISSGFLTFLLVFLFMVIPPIIIYRFKHNIK